MLAPRIAVPPISSWRSVVDTTEAPVKSGTTTATRKAMMPKTATITDSPPTRMTASAILSATSTDRRVSRRRSKRRFGLCDGWSIRVAPSPARAPPHQFARSSALMSSAAISAVIGK